MIERFKRVAADPATKKAFKSLKPQKSFWGIFSIVVIFILPEIVAFIWGTDITTYCQLHLQDNLSFEEKAYYQGLEFLFCEGSWINLILGFGLFIWLFF